MPGPIPKPWLRKSTGSWYVTLNGRQISLGPDRKAAWKAYHLFMIARSQGVPSDGRITVSELIEAYLADCTELSPETTRPRRIRLTALARYCGGMLVADIKPHHVRRWANQTWSNRNTRIAGMTVAKRCLEWGEEAGYIELNPIRKLKLGKMGRRAPITLEEAETVIARMPPHGALALRVLLATGMRPGELCSLTAQETAPDARQTIVSGKSGRRVIVLSDHATSLLEPLLAIRQSGPLFFHGAEPMTPAHLSRMVRDVRGELKHVTPHCFRGLFSTLALKQGVDSVLISRLLGHSDLSILSHHYLGDVTPELREAADRVGRTVHTPRGRQQGARR